MARAWLVDCKGIARKVKNAPLSSVCQVKDYGANRECPNCHYRIDNSDVLHEWPGLPTGVKFDPSDAEILEHLAAKCGLENSKPHMFIDEFIPTLEGDGGICYTHPENLPGAKKNGNSVHFFYKTMNAYATGQRKRRKIHDQQGLTNEHVRWHKTGKTKPVMDNGIQRGCKKIMVLYKTSNKGPKPDKSNWVMHQYHLGTDEDEKEGEYVVSKIFYQQPKQTDKNVDSPNDENLDMGKIRTSPRTPNTQTPNPPRPGNSVSRDDITNECLPLSSAQEADFTPGTSHPSPYTNQPKEELDYSSWLAGESQAPDVNGIDDSLLCNEIFDTHAPLGELGVNPAPGAGFGCNNGNAAAADRNANCGIPDLDNLEFDTPPDFQLADLQFGSQDSIFGWLDWQ